MVLVLSMAFRLKVDENSKINLLNHYASAKKSIGEYILKKN